LRKKEKSKTPTKKAGQPSEKKPLLGAEKTGGTQQLDSTIGFRREQKENGEDLSTLKKKNTKANAR